MFFNLLTGIQDNQQTGPKEPIFQGQAISNAQQWIIGIIAFAIIITIFATIMLFCCYSQTQKPKKLYKYLIVILGIIIVIAFIILGITACKSIR